MAQLRPRCGANSHAPAAVSERVQRGLWSTLKEDWRFVREESRPSWRRQLEQTVEELQEFYLTPADRHRLSETKRPWTWLLLGWWLLRALLLKLTPTRRLILVVALGCLWLSNVQLKIGANATIDFDLDTVGQLLLVGILLLELRDKLLARDELQAGRAVQMALMPERAPSLQGWDIWMLTRPANDVGGDLVDSLELSPGRVGLVLSDVAGKALPAALLMAKVQSTLRALASDEVSLGDLASRTNEILCRDGLPNRFATLVYLDLRGDSGHVRLLNAGHPPPIVVSASRFHQLQPGNLALGLMPGVAFAEQTVELQPGDLLVAYSDGVTEALNDAGDFFGEDRLHAVLPVLNGVSAREGGVRLLETIDRFTGDRRPHDDLSLIVLKRLAHVEA